MYKLLLCWRYLLTRYIALASIVSVMLGVAAMIIVNSVMSGFTTEMQDRIHGVLSDVIVESRSMDGFDNPEAQMDKIRAIVGDDIEGMTVTVMVPAALCFEAYGSGEEYTLPIQLIGIDTRTQGDVGDFLKHLQHPSNREAVSFDLREDGYDTKNYTAGEDAARRADLGMAGWKWRRIMAERKALRQALDAVSTPRNGPQPMGPSTSIPTDGDTDTAETEPAEGDTPVLVELPTNMFDVRPQNDQSGEEQLNIFDPSKKQHAGAILGIGTVAQRVKCTDPKTGETFYEERFPVIPGDDVTICVPTIAAGPTLKPGFEDDMFTVVDFYESKMSEYDSQFVFVPLEKLQDLRGMIDPETGQRYATQILINVKDDRDINLVRDKLREAFPSHQFVVNTWRDKQTALLAAVDIEVAILNVLLFIIIAVAGFGILAIFFMIVLEKTRDIGILKSLGASSTGIMQIFVTYGLSLGLLGSGVGLIGGLLFVHYINEIADVLSSITGHEVFDPTIYYFYEIPTVVNPWTICWIMVGAVAIAVGASIFPAIRAARMHPVRALRYE